MSSKYHSASHAKYLIQYHIIWCPKFRFSVLTGDIETKLKEIGSNRAPGGLRNNYTYCLLQTYF